MLMEGFSMVLSDPLSVVLVAVGTLIGTIFGAIPGLTATMAVTICLPMTFAMSDSRAIALLMALYIGGISGGLVSSILLNIPGTPASMVTAFDGAPMARKGEGAKALGTGIFFSFLGTIFGLIALIIIAPYLAAVAIKFGAFEYCALSIFSLSLVISLAGKDMVKGLAAALLGVMFSTFGISTFDSIVRYDFGSVNMQSGFQQLVVLIGLYAIPEVVGVAQKVVKPKVIMQQNTTVDKIHGLGFTWQEFKSQIGNFFIAAAIGTGIGILPGIGGGTAGIMSYTTIKNRSKTPEKFGTGIMDGVVASETANNAAIGGAMIPLLTLGIPGDGITAILLGSLIIHGIAPGPLIFEKSGALMYSIYLIIGLSSLFMMIRGVLVSPAPMTNMATNMTTFVLMKPPKASAGVLMPVRISARMMPVEMTENGTLPDTKAMIVTSRMTSVISNGLIWVVLLWITSTLQMQSSGKGV